MLMKFSDYNSCSLLENRKKAELNKLDARGQHVSQATMSKHL